MNFGIVLGLSIGVTAIILAYLDEREAVRPACRFCRGQVWWWRRSEFIRGSRTCWTCYTELDSLLGELGYRLLWPEGKTECQNQNT